MYIGMYGEKSVNIKEGMQQSLVVTGIPGSGKSCRLQKIEYELVKVGGTAIVVDVTPAHDPERILPEISGVYEHLANRIDAVKDGLSLPLLQPFQTTDGDCESDFRIINSIASILSDSRNGSRQLGELRETVERAMLLKRRKVDLNDMDAIRAVLEVKRKMSDGAEGLYQQLWSLFRCGIFRNSDRRLEAGRINVIDFSGADISTAAICANLLLSILWRKAYLSDLRNEFGTTLIIVDECPLLPLRLDSPIGIMLSEGRKFGANLALGLQSMSALKPDEQSVVGLAATKLYFQPERRDEKKIMADLLQTVGERAKRFRVDDLHVGEAIAMGPLECGGYPVNGAILTD